MNTQVDYKVAGKPGLLPNVNVFAPKEVLKQLKEAATGFMPPHLCGSPERPKFYSGLIDGKRNGKMNFASEGDLALRKHFL